MRERRQAIQADLQALQMLILLNPDMPQAKRYWRREVNRLAKESATLASQYLRHAEQYLARAQQHTATRW